MAYRGTSLSPFFGSTAPLFGLRREIDRVFDDLLGGPSTARWTPAVDVREDDRQLALDIELPGLNPDDVEINVENGILSVSGEKRARRKEGEEGRYHSVERTYGSFFRSFQLPQGVDESQITAEFTNGVLTITIPKAALPQPRRIEIGRPGAERRVQGQQPREPASGAGRSSTQGAAGEREAEERMAASAREQRDE